MAEIFSYWRTTVSEWKKERPDRSTMEAVAARRDDANACLRKEHVRRMF